MSFLKAKKLPDNVRVLTIFGAEYWMPWEDMRRGCSCFLPTTATAQQVAELLGPIEKYLGWHFAVANRCEYGRYGVRIWRMV
jgi:hypothetical protein